MEEIFIITALTCLTKHRDKKVIAWFGTQKEAVAYAKKEAFNITDEGDYSYVLVEKIKSGNNLCDIHDVWFKYNKKTQKLNKIARPKSVKHICCFGMG